LRPNRFAEISLIHREDAADFALSCYFWCAVDQEGKADNGSLPREAPKASVTEELAVEIVKRWTSHSSMKAVLLVERH